MIYNSLSLSRIVTVAESGEMAMRDESGKSSCKPMPNISTDSEITSSVISISTNTLLVSPSKMRVLVKDM